MADDDESLDEILSGTATAESVTTEEDKTAEPVRDEHGRFAPKSGEGELDAPTDDNPADEPQPEPEHNAPVAAVIAERRKAQAERERGDQLDARIKQLETMLMQRGSQTATPAPQPEPVQPPEIWENPQGFVEHALTPLQQQLAETTFRLSRAEAFAEFGKDTVSAAEAAMKQAVESGQLDPASIKATLSKSRDPVGDVVRWHQSSPAVQQATMRETLRAELMAELGIDPSQPTPSPAPSPRNAPIVKMPPSLTKIPAGHSVPERDESLDEVLTAPRRRA